MNKEQLKLEITKIPGENGFWHSTTKDDFMEVSQKLLDRGFSCDEALGILRTMYYSVSNEYGS